MSHTLMSLDAEWRRLARTSRARRALEQWSVAHPALRGLADLDALLERRRDDQAAPAILRALAVLAPATIWPPAPCCRRCCPAWSAWRGWSATTTRPRSRKWCRWPGNAFAPIRPGAGDPRPPTCCSTYASATAPTAESRRPARPTPRIEAAATSRSPEDEALARVLFEQLIAAQRAEQVLRDGAFGLVLRTRLAGEPLTAVARKENLPLSVLAQRRWRAECRLRQLPLAG